jgi:hypothetical protein
MLTFTWSARRWTMCVFVLPFLVSSNTGVRLSVLLLYFHLCCTYTFTLFINRYIYTCAPARPANLHSHTYLASPRAERRAWGQTRVHRVLPAGYLGKILGAGGAGLPDGVVTGGIVECK